jgi:hypothetical protein
MYLNTTPENQIKKEYEVLFKSGEIRVNLRAKKHGKSFIPDSEGDVELWAIFKPMGVEDYWVVERSVKTPTERDGVRDVDYDTEEMERKILKNHLKKWSLDIPLQFDEEKDQLTDECLRVVLSQPAPLIGSFVEEYHNSFRITNEEKQQIDKQCAVLFSKNSRGVDAACDAVTLFCVLGNMWEKFGLNRFDLKKLSYKEYAQLRMVLSHEIEKQRRENNTNKKQGSAMVAGAGGRTRPSRGIVVQG